MKVELIYFDGCPNINDTRALLVKALVKLKQPVKWIEWNSNDEQCPREYASLGSPTVLIDGLDVAPPQFDSQGDCCRIYMDEQSNQVTGNPGLIAIIKAIENATNQLKINMPSTTIRPKWIAFLSAIPSIFIALLPKLTCPMCWPAYTAVLSALGINFVNYTPYLPLVITTLLAISLSSIAYKAPTRHGYKPFWIGVVASVGVLLGQFALKSTSLFFTSSLLLITAAIWNALPNNKKSCYNNQCFSAK